MSRLIAMFAALALSTITLSSACIAAPASGLSFTLEPSTKGDHIRATFRKIDRETNNWSTSFAPAELAGLDVARFRAAGTHPISFAIVREAGRVDCAGTGGNSLARGSCQMTPDAAFIRLLEQRGIPRPTEEQAYGLISLNVRRELVDALAAARYPAPRVNDLMSLTALGVTRTYISELARAGYRPQSLDTLLQFKALNITPDYIRGFVRLGYSNLPASELIQLKALNITADFVAGFERIGYGRLPASQLVQLQALGVTPDYVAGFQRAGYRNLPVSKLIELKALGVTPQFVRAMQADDGSMPFSEEVGRRRPRSR
ncbi:MAG TPA: hypothetical protein VM346_09435 [Sphingomicrobium sp.]|nr:hypothetical protein [Sphingomicrobium sp.]